MVQRATSQGVFDFGVVAAANGEGARCGVTVCKAAGLEEPLKLKRNEPSEHPMLWLIRLTLTIGMAMLTSVALAQSYPARPLRLLVSFPPGGASDIVARLLGQSLAPRLGQPV